MGRDVSIALSQTFIAAALWGTSFPVVSNGLRAGLNPLAFVFLRFGLAAPIMLATAFFMRRQVVRLLRSRGIWIVALFNTSGFLFQFVGQQYTDASVASLLVNLSVVFSAVGGSVLLGERLGRSKTAGVVFAFSGSILVVTKGDFGVISGGQLFGDLLYVAAAFAWAGYILYAKKRTDEGGWDPVSSAACIVSLTAVFLLPGMIWVGAASPISVASWETIAYTAVFNTVIPYFLYQAGLKRLTVTTSAILLMVEVVVAVSISVGFLGESFNWISVVGTAGILASIILVSGVEVRGKNLSVSQKEAPHVKVLQ